MHAYHAAVVEVEQLMLAAALHARDARTRQRLERCRSDSATKCGMKQPYPLDGAPLRATTQHLHGGFDLGELGHAAFLGGR